MDERSSESRRQAARNAGGFGEPLNRRSLASSDQVSQPFFPEVHESTPDPLLEPQSIDSDLEEARVGDLEPRAHYRQEITPGIVHDRPRTHHHHVHHAHLSEPTGRDPRERFSIWGRHSTYAQTVVGSLDQQGFSSATPSKLGRIVRRLRGS